MPGGSRESLSLPAVTVRCLRSATAGTPGVWLKLLASRGRVTLCGARCAENTVTGRGVLLGEIMSALPSNLTELRASRGRVTCCARGAGSSPRSPAFCLGKS